MAPIRCCFDQTAVWHSDAARGPSTPSFDHLVGADEQRLRHGKAERLGGLEVHHKLVLGGRLHRQVSWFLALQNAIDVACRAPVLVDSIRSVGDQGAFRDAKAVGVDGGQLVLRGELCDQMTMNRRRCAPCYNQTAIWRACESRDAALDLVGVAHIDWAYLHPE